jgi:shikimate dehydrogenase
VSREEKPDVLVYSDLNRDIIESHKLIVNATPLGMFPKTEECPPIPYEYITDEHLLVDVVYNPPETLFLKKGKERGATILNGEGMWAGQAEATWRIWNE